MLSQSMQALDLPGQGVVTIGRRRGIAMAGQIRGNDAVVGR